MKEITAEQKKIRRKKLITAACFIVFNVLAIAIVLLLENKGGDVALLDEVFATLGQNVGFTILALSMFIVQISADTTGFFFLTRQVGLKKNFAVSLNTAVLGKYYDKLTPWATGGQPFQMAYLSTHGLDTPTGCSIPLAKSVIKVFSIMLVVLPVLTVMGILMEDINVLVMVAAYISIAGTLLFPITFIIFIRHPKLGQKLVKGIVGFFYKIKIVKDYEKALNKFSDMMGDFLKGMGYLSSHKKMIVVIGIMTLLDLFATNSIPYFVIRAFGMTNINYWNTFVLCLFVTYASSFFPTPGSAGGAELSFYAIFAAVIPDAGYLFWAVLFWRIVLYYLPIFVGLIFQIVEIVSKKINNKRVNN